MENASKALLMAGGMLIALMIAAVVALMFSRMSGYWANEESIAQSKHAAEFNNQFEPYIKDGLTLFELKSVYNKIMSNNQQNQEYTIETNIPDLFPITVLSYTINFDTPNIADDYDFVNNFAGIHDTCKNKRNLTFNCVTDGNNRVRYNGPEGTIDRINFVIGIRRN